MNQLGGGVLSGAAGIGQALQQQQKAAYESNEPARESHLQEQARIHCELSQSILDRLGNLAARLQPVMRSEPTAQMANQASSPEPYMVQFADGMRQSNKTLGLCLVAIEEILQRLEV